MTFTLDDNHVLNQYRYCIQSINNSALDGYNWAVGVGNLSQKVVEMLLNNGYEIKQRKVEEGVCIYISW